MNSGLVSVAILTILLALRIPIGIAMIIVGFGGTYILVGLSPAFATLTGETFELATRLELMVIPFFVLMGNLAGTSGLSRELFEGANAVMGRIRGGLACATVLACAGFAALCGSSVASAVTMGRVAIPEMRRFNYDGRLSTGVVAAGGTLGILIPPSTGFVIYGILTEQSIGKLFLAGVIPGLILTGLFIIAVIIVTTLNPEFAPRGKLIPLPQRIKAVLRALPFIAIIVLTIGGIYAGIFTAMESAAVGAILAFAVALLRRSLNAENFRKLLLDTVHTTVMIYVILIGSEIFTPFLARTGLPGQLSSWMLSFNLGYYGNMTVLMVLFYILGTALDGFAILVLTLPVVYPVILALGYDPIWFGVIMVICLEMSLISPPVGMNVFVLKSIAPEVPMQDIFRGTTPFLIAMFVCVAILVVWPEVALWMPRSMSR